MNLRIWFLLLAFNTTAFACQYGIIFESYWPATDNSSYVTLNIINSSGNKIDFLSLRKNEIRAWFSPTNDPYYIKLNDINYHSVSSIAYSISISIDNIGINNTYLEPNTGFILETPCQNPNLSTHLFSDSGGNIYSETELIDERGISLEFNPPIPVFRKNFFNTYGYYASDPFTDTLGINWQISGRNWSLLNLRNYNGSTKVVIGKDPFNEILDSRVNNAKSLLWKNDSWSYNHSNYPSDKETTALWNNSGYLFASFDHPSYSSESIWRSQIVRLINNFNSSRTFLIGPGQTHKLERYYIHSRYPSSGYAFSYWLKLVLLSDVVDLTEDNSTSFRWENDSISIPAKFGNENKTIQLPMLKSVFLPKSSKTYSKMLFSDEVTTSGQNYSTEQNDPINITNSSKNNSTIYSPPIEVSEPLSLLDVWILEINRWFSEFYILINGGIA